MRTCGNETKYYTKYKWYSKEWEIKICGVTTGFICDVCSAYNEGYKDGSQNSQITNQTPLGCMDAEHTEEAKGKEGESPQVEGISDNTKKAKGCGKSFRDNECDDYEFIICGYEDKELGGTFYCDKCSTKTQKVKENEYARIKKAY